MRWETLTNTKPLHFMSTQYSAFRLRFFQVHVMKLQTVFKIAFVVELQVFRIDVLSVLGFTVSMKNMSRPAVMPANKIR